MRQAECPTLMKDKTIGIGVIGRFQMQLQYGNTLMSITMIGTFTTQYTQTPTCGGH
jgi:hypothetical protein